MAAFLAAGLDAFLAAGLAAADIVDVEVWEGGGGWDDVGWTCGKKGQMVVEERKGGKGTGQEADGLLGARVRQSQRLTDSIIDGRLEGKSTLRRARACIQAVKKIHSPISTQTRFYSLSIPGSPPPLSLAPSLPPSPLSALSAVMPRDRFQSNVRIQHL